MKNLTTLLIFLCIHFICIAQPERSDNWYFGFMAGINFSTGVPIALNGGMTTNNEGCASVSDSLGNSLFYTDGVTIWNRIHQAMPNGTGLMGDVSSSQSAIIIAAPGSQTEYYVFTMDDEGGPNGFRYSIVDMTLQSGKGDVTAVKNIPVNTNMTEKLTAVQQIGTLNFWIATHQWNSDAFYVYSLTSGGLQPNPVVTNVGTVHNNSVTQNTYGLMKFNVCGDKLALAIAYQNTVEIFDFNNATGVVSNPITLPFAYHVYGVEFSKDSHFLYVSNYDPGGTLLQYDITSGNVSTILSTATVLSTTPDIYGLQLANNGRIYATRTNSPFLGEISFPNIAGVGCSYTDNGVNVDPHGTGLATMLGLPAVVSSYLRAEAFCNVPSGFHENNAEQMMDIFPNPSGNSFQLKSYAAEMITLNVMDETGRVIQQQNILPGSSENFGKDLKPGIYLVKIQNEKVNLVKRIVKSN